MIKDSWKEKGFIDEPIPKGIDLPKAIREMCKEKDAIILAHYYTDKSLQDVADFIGDSLALAREAATTNAKIIVMCGVHFMAETNKILTPNKKCITLDLNSGCSLATSCPAEGLKALKEKHPDHIVISYVNSSAAVKALTDVCVTSANACEIIDSFAKGEKIIFCPDRNLGNYINLKTGRHMLLWDGACSVHERFSVEKILELKIAHPDARVLVHPECKNSVLTVANKIGSTAALLKYTISSHHQEFIVATESGIIYQMQKESPEKKFYPVPPEYSEDSSVTCSCNECAYMRLNTLEKLYNSLKYEWPEINISENICTKAIKSIDNMLQISSNLGL